ncbi:hypothetical protein [Streptomonospora litoralis]|uniref:Uncharacterized protein n=1 Tax=Streptomonospora litoralis TaxID=2498135 RepID=A0A4P6PZ94_9ACTN|nr:hypothetical protein [Streptomonospora litoralis]QBI52221.1 hypothetical protein EKD16_02025 [Streptomonospora litoralis]
MGTGEWNTPRLTEDVHFQLAGPKPGYAPTASGPVRYRRIAWSGGDVIGYLWYSDTENAAGYVPEAAAGDDAFNAGTFWYRRFAEAGDRGLSPSEAVAEFRERNTGSRGAGWIVADSESEATSVERLSASAGVSPNGVPLKRPDQESGRRRGTD